MAESPRLSSGQAGGFYIVTPLAWVRAACTERKWARCAVAWYLYSFLFRTSFIR